MPRQKLIGVRLSAPEYDRLATAAAAAGAAPATLARRLLRDHLDPLPAPPATASSLAAPAAPVPPSAPAAPSDPLTRTVATRLTADEHAALHDRATAAGLAVGTYLRHLLRGLPPAPRRPLTRTAVVALNRVGNNLNQLTKLAHTGVLLPRDLLATLQAVHAEVRRLREALELEP